MWETLDSRTVAAIKILVASAAALVLAWSLRFSTETATGRRIRLRDQLLALAGIVAFACWWNLGRFHFVAGYVQLGDQYHYYLGAKYARELGYTRLYECTAVADSQDGLAARVRQRWIRNLQTNELERTTAILADPRPCTSRFTAERWSRFKEDVGWFRSRLSADAWDRLQIDHGYNATPVWTIAGHALANLAPASERQVVTLSLIDPALILVMWATVWWAFGWRAMCVALLWWGTNYPARFAWTGGGFLRADWLVLAVLAIALVRRGRYAMGGFALAYASLLRVFPVLLVTGLAAKSLAAMWKARSWRLPEGHARFAAGGIVATLVLVPLSIGVVGGGWRGGLDLWKEFFQNSRKHYETPATNNVGLRALAAYGGESRLAVLENYWVETPLDSWMAARRRVLAERQPFYVLLVLAFLPMFVRAVMRRSDWAALAFGAALLPVAIELTCYYYGVLLVLGLLWLEDRWCGVALAATAALSNLPAGLFTMEDDVYAAVTAISLVLVTAVTVRLMRERAVPPTSSDRPALSS